LRVSVGGADVFAQTGGAPDKTRKYKSKRYHVTMQSETLPVQSETLPVQSENVVGAKQERCGCVCGTKQGVWMHVYIVLHA